MDLISSFIDYLLRGLNDLVYRYRIVDRVLLEVADNELLQFGVLVAILAALWALAAEDEDRKTRSLLFTAMLMSAASFVLARTLAWVLPLREIPLLDPGMELRTAFDMELPAPATWSVMPSEHATLAVALTTTLFFFSWRLGLFASLWTLFIVFLPRLMLGLAWPTDLLAGAVLSVILVGRFAKPLTRHPGVVRVLQTEAGRPIVYNAVVFLVFYQFATLFGDLRGLAVLVADTVSHLLSKI